MSTRPTVRIPPPPPREKQHNEADHNEDKSEARRGQKSPGSAGSQTAASHPQRLWSWLKTK